MTSKALERPVGRQATAREWLLRYNLDYALLVATVLLVVFGVVMVYSASYVVAYDAWGDPNYFFVRQLIWAVIGSGVLFGIARMPYHWWARLAVPALLAAVTLLLLVQFTPLGVEAGGARRWLRLGPLPPVQPSDFVKLGLVLFLSVFLARRLDCVREVRHGLLPFGLVVGGVAAIMIAQRDLGTTIIILAVAIVVFYAAGAESWQVGGMVLAGLGYIVFQVAVEPYRLARIEAFLNPLQAQDSTYQLSHLLMALGSGGLTGHGLGASREKYFYLPNAHNDSIFGVIGEELGFGGCTMVVILFAILAWRGYQIALRAPDRQGFLLATGVTTWLTFQALVNMAGATNLLPFTGVPLPFISSGGSSLLAGLFGVGLLLNISRHRADVAEVGRRQAEG